jgi:hypothetical protein
MAQDFLAHVLLILVQLLRQERRAAPSSEMRLSFKVHINFY